MSKKSRKNPSKPDASKVTKRASKPVAKKAAKAATKGPAKKSVAKPAKPTVKAVAKPAAKSAAKTSKAPVARKPAAAKTVAAKTVAAKATTTKPAVAKPAVAKAVVAKAVVAKAPAAKAPAKTSAKTIAKPAAKMAPKNETAPVSKPEVAAPAAPSVAAEGARAPDFQLPRDGGATVSLSDYAGQKLVIFFYPRASTPGCTKEAIDFTRLSGDFQTAGAAVLGVSADPLKAQETFRDKYRLGVPLLSDATQTMLKSYGAWGEKSMYGKVFEGVLRTTVLIDQKGSVAKIWRSVKVDGHADAVLEETRQI